MQDLYGWITSDREREADRVIALNKMLAAKGTDPKLANSYLAPDGAVAATGALTSLAEENGLLSVIAGRPRFSEPKEEVETPAQCVLRLWRKYGEALPTKIQGPFAFAVVDTLRRSVFLAIDRMGIHSMAFSLQSGGLAFSNRADAVAAHPGVDTSIDPQGLFHYFYFGDVPAPATIFQGVEKLLPAQWAHWKDGRLERGFYWHLHYRDEPRNDFEVQAAHFKRLLRESVERAKGTDDVAAFLSGGTDSSTVAGMLTDLQGKAARTYSIGFDAEGFDEMEYARLAAKHFGLDAREYYLKPDDVFAAIPIIAAQYDEPFANESAVSAYCCAKLAAADGYRVMLAGDGGDEIFGGNARYALQKVFEVYGTIPGFLRKGLIESICRLPGVATLPPGRKLSSYIRQANVPLPDRLESYNFIFRQPLGQMFTKDFLAQVDPSLPAAGLREAYYRADTSHFINRMLHLDLKFTLADNDLRKVSGMTEAAGVEVRYPLLDDEVVAFSGEVPPDWKVKRLYLRWFFKNALKGYLPEAIIKKRKHGFGLPFGVWARDHQLLREQVEDRLTDFQKRRCLKSAYVDHLRTAHMTEHATYFGKMLWNIVMLEEWLSVRTSVALGKPGGLVYSAHVGFLESTVRHRCPRARRCDDE